MSKVSSFNGNDATFVPGKIYGLRSFELSQYGTLASITANGSWRTEEKAYCALGKHHGQPAPQHKCGCGLYGYFTPENDEFYTPAYVSAVFEAHGNIIIGERGFRAEKARLLAYSLPQSDLVKQHAKLTILKVVLLFIFTGLAIFISRGITDYEILQFVFFVFIVYLNIVVLFKGIRAFVAYNMSRWGDAKIISELRKNYPNVEVFSSRQELLNAYSTHLSQSQELADTVTKQKVGLNRTIDLLSRVLSRLNPVNIKHDHDSK